MAVPRSRIVDLMRVQCRIFNTTFNPSRLRMGTKILSQRLRGPAVASYYPPRIGTTKDLRRLYPDFDVADEKEDDWVEKLKVMKLKGKNPPKKKRTAGESKKFGKRKSG